MLEDLKLMFILTNFIFYVLTVSNSKLAKANKFNHYLNEKKN